MSTQVVPADFTLQQLRAFIEGEAQQTPEGFFTAREWAEYFDISVQMMRDLLAKAKARGLLDVRTEQREMLDGRPYWAPIYALRKPADEGQGGDE